MEFNKNEGLSFLRSSRDFLSSLYVVIMCENGKKTGFPVLRYLNGMEISMISYIPVPGW